MRCGLELLVGEGRVRRARIQDHGKQRGSRDDLAQQLKPDALYASGYVRQSGDVAAGPGETCNDPGADRIADSHEYNRNAVSGCLARLGGNRAKSADKHIGLHPNEVGRKAWQEFRPAFRAAKDEVQVLSVNVTKLIETTQKIWHEATILTCKKGEVGDGD
jgi:hypothetical protein